MDAATPAGTDTKQFEHLNKPEAILVAAYLLAIAGTTRCSLQQLIVEAWRLSPTKLGLKGYTDRYPDSNKVVSLLSGTRSLVQRGFLGHEPKSAFYELTVLGRERARKLAPCTESEAEHMAPPALRNVLSPQQEHVLLRLLESDAAYRRRQGEMPGPADARAFWNVGDGALQQEIDTVRHTLEQQLLAIQALIPARMVLSNGLEVESTDVAALLELHRTLSRQYGGMLAVRRRVS